MKLLLALAALPLLAYDARFIFPPQPLHSHSSSIVELPGGDLFAVWYIGSGERSADDVLIQGARLKRGAKVWSAPFTIADTPGFPDCNPIAAVDARGHLMVVWPVILDNHWESALLKILVADDGGRANPIRWTRSDNILLRPEGLGDALSAFFQPYIEKPLDGFKPGELKRARERANDKLYNRLGWMPRTHMLELPSGRLLLPLYTDTFSVSLIAITDDGGAHWTASKPILGLGAVQPALVRRRDGRIVAYMRDNGPAPKRVMVSESSDNGMTWTPARDTDIPNPGSSVEVISLRDGSWVMVLNDTEKGRQRLSVWLSEDEGRTWPHRRALEDQTKGGYSYPGVIQDSRGAIHVTYSHSVDKLQSIKHVSFDRTWITEKE